MLAFCLAGAASRGKCRSRIGMREVLAGFAQARRVEAEFDTCRSW
jgi:hypothetical protein